MQTYNDIDISVVLKKTEDLRSLFHLGQKVIPFLDEIQILLRDLPPLLDEINASIAENVKKMPNATEQLSKVTQANEVATTEIMDITDNISSNAMKISKNLKKYIEESTANQSIVVDVLQLILDSILAGKDLTNMAPQIEEIIVSLKDVNSPFNGETLSQNKALLNKISEDSNSIMILLQVQDISAQQIASVNHTLKSIQQKLRGILINVQNSEFQAVDASLLHHDSTTNVTMLHREISFDSQAIDTIDSHTQKQQTADQLIQHSLDEAKDSEEADTDIDIDSFFN